eukprot:gnl/MRDRNA2_/MRDRNA2_187164_c0_seq1.p1 gnl/MRDRNA2_/MRDRNA2_187164_c0~~gnl/MRDRNA2_/MRDRNA2_187164_c0_seq1.p1  ORF type:complete len:372 (-),score=63.03 gnl/MRDRNA2_/MRDRNA2_187164_c0_seq1:5-1120(-)
MLVGRRELNTYENCEDGASCESTQGEEDESEDDEPWWSARKLMRHYMQRRAALVNLGLGLVWLSVGVIVGMKVEGWSLTTSLYVLTQIVTTVGYGDVTVDTETMRMFMAFYVLFGVAFVANVLNDVFEHMVTQRSHSLARKFHAMSERVKKRKEAQFSELNLQQVRMEVPWSRLSSAFVIFSFILLAATAFYATYEDCSCSYGVSAIANCTEEDYEGQDMCYNGEAPGKQKTWAEAFYMSAITVTTVGFGDYTPVSEWGRIFGVILMFVGVTASVDLMTQISRCLFVAVHHMRVEQMSLPLFQAIDKDGSGELDRSEFLIFMAIKENLLTSEQFERINDIFESLDRNNSGTLSYDEILQSFGQKGDPSFPG